MSNPARVSPVVTYSTVRTNTWGYDDYGAPNTAYNVYAPFRLTFTRNVTANFHSLKRRDALRELPYSMVKDIVRIGRFNYEVTYYDPAGNAHRDGAFDGWTRSFADTTPFYYSPKNFVEDCRNKAALRIQKQASGVQVNLAQFFAERKQTADLLASTATRIYEAARALKRADLRGLMRTLSIESSISGKSLANRIRRVERTPVSKRLANHWLEFQYGWKPLLSDVYASAELIAAKVADTQMTHGRLRSSSVGSGAESTHNPTVGIWVNRSTAHRVEVRSRLKYHLENVGSQVLAQTGITNPALLAWELLPYSFIVDWFLPVGNYLEGMTAFDGFHIIDAGTSVFRESTLSASMGAGSSKDPQYSYAGAAGGHEQRTLSFDRYTTVASYIPTVRSPLGGAPLERVTTALSLLRQLFGR